MLEVPSLCGRAILTVFQIQDAENDPLTRTSALSSGVSHSESYTSCASTTCVACPACPAGPRYIPRYTLSPNRTRKRQKQPYSGTGTFGFWNLACLVRPRLHYHTINSLVCLSCTGARHVRDSTYITCQVVLGLCFSGSSYALLGITKRSVAKRSPCRDFHV